MRLAAILLLTLAACAPSGRDPSDDDADAGTAADAGTSPDAGATPDAGDPQGDGCNEVGTSATDPAAHDALVACLASGAAAPAKSTAVATFVELVERRGGFPIAAGAEVIFAGLGEPPGVAGDFNEWQPASATSHGNGFWSGRIAIAADRRGGAKYKLVRGTTFSADPLARRFQFDEYGEFSLVAGGTTSSHLERIANVHATRLGSDRPLYVYVPAGYEATGASYPVLYMHDGQNLFDASMERAAPASWQADAVADEEIRSGRARPFLIVGVPNTLARFDEYTLTKDTIGGNRVGGRGADYADFLVREVKTLVDARYRTLADRAHTALLGSSLGGLISYEIALLHPDVFGAVGGMSSTFSWGTLGESQPTVIDRYRAATSLVAGNHVFYLDSGGGAPEGCSNADPEGSDNYCATLAMKAVLESKGFTVYPLDPDAAQVEPANANIEHWWEPDAPHSETAWNGRLFRVFRFFFRLQTGG